MKKIVLAFMIVALSGVTFAQNAKVQSANNYLKYNELKKAKGAIDLASVHSKTGNQAKTWYTYGKVYYAIAMDTTSETAGISEDAIFKAADAFEKVKANPDSRTDIGELYTYLYGKVYNKVYSDAVGFYNKKEFASSAKYFSKCGEIKATIEELDTVAYYYAGNMAAAAEDHENSIKYFNKIKNTGYEGGSVYSRIANQYKAMGDTTQAFTTISEGRAQYPDDQGLLIAEFNMYVELGETEKALTNIDKAIAADPENVVLYYNRGILRSTVGDIAGSQADYEKVLSIDPNHLGANHDLGALFVNNASALVEEINAIPPSDMKAYDAKKAELDETYVKALPYLEKAYELDPSDREVQGILKQIYLRSKDMDKYKKIDAEIKAAEAGN